MSTLKDQLQIGRAVTMHNRVRGIKPVKQLENQIEMLISQMTLVASQRDDALLQLQAARNYIARNMEAK